MFWIGFVTGIASFIVFVGISLFFVKIPPKEETVKFYDAKIKEAIDEEDYEFAAGLKILKEKELKNK